MCVRYDDFIHPKDLFRLRQKRSNLRNGIFMRGLLGAGKLLQAIFRFLDKLLRLYILMWIGGGIVRGQLTQLCGPVNRRCCRS